MMKRGGRRPPYAEMHTHEMHKDMDMHIWAPWPTGVRGRRLAEVFAVDGVSDTDHGGAG